MSVCCGERARRRMSIIETASVYLVLYIIVYTAYIELSRPSSASADICVMLIDLKPLCLLSLAYTQRRTHRSRPVEWIQWWACLCVHSHSHTQIDWAKRKLHQLETISKQLNRNSVTFPMPVSVEWLRYFLHVWCVRIRYTKPTHTARASMWNVLYTHFSKIYRIEC